MIQVAPGISIRQDELRFSFVRASGPGGQNVNKVSSAVQLRFDVTGSPRLPEALKRRLARLAGSRMTAEGVLVIEAREHRGQLANRKAALDRLTDLLCRAAVPPRRRVPTAPTPTSRLRRLERKQRRGRTKRLRRGTEP